MAAQSNLIVSSNRLHIPHSIHLFPGEKHVMWIPGSRVLLYRGQILRAGAALFFVLISVVAFRRPDLQWIGIITVVIALVLVSVMLEKIINYRYNICILTDRRVIDIKRSYLLIREMRTETEYDSIREVKVSVANLFERLFHIGTIHIETLTTSPGICLSHVDRPFVIQETIYHLRDQFVR